VERIDPQEVTLAQTEVCATGRGRPWRRWECARGQWL